MERLMERRIAQVFDVELTVPDESVDASTPTVVLSAAPLKACVRASAPTVRHVAVGRLPGTALGTQPPGGRHAKMWVIEEPLETAPVGAIPMPGERARAAVSSHEPPARGSSSAAVTFVEPHVVRAQRNAAAEPHVVRAHRNSAAEPHVVRAQRNPAVMLVEPRAGRACEPAAQYSVERELQELTRSRAAASRWQPKARRSAHVLVLIIGVLAGFLTVLSVVVVRQRRALSDAAEPAQRVNAACAAYAKEVRNVAVELTRAAGDVKDVENRAGERARNVVSDRGMQRLCAAPLEVACSPADAACVASTVMQLRQALAHR